MKLYGKGKLKERLDNMAAEERLPHAILLYGSRGAGKKVTANYISKLFICGSPPCGKCRNCANIDADAHPDVIFAKRICENGKYKMEDLREKVINSMAVKPNDGDIKVYIFEDFDELKAQPQNTLLKAIEEPLPFLRFILICENINLVIETILSRVTKFEVQVPSEEECASCLRENGVEAKKAEELSALFSGNIGSCITALKDDNQSKLMEAARKAGKGIAMRSGYLTAAALSSVTAREDFAVMLEYLTGILRDAMVIKYGGRATSCGKMEAAKIAEKRGADEIAEMIEVLFEVMPHGKLNLNLALTASYLTSKLAQ